MTKDELIRDLCSVEFRSKSKTRELIDEFLKTHYSVSEWAKIGKERGYWDYFRDLIRIKDEEELIKSIVNNWDDNYWSSDVEKLIKDYYNK